MDVQDFETEVYIIQLACKVSKFKGILEGSVVFLWLFKDDDSCIEA